MSTSSPREGAPIAIVGMAGTYAGAPDRQTFWHNILNKVDAIGEAPADWVGPYFDADSDANDRIYTRKGGFLEARFNPMRYGIMPRAVDGGEPDQYLALKLAHEALDDAGYLDADFDRSRAGVVLGRGTYINRGYTNLLQHGMMIDQTLALLAQARPDLDAAQLATLRQGLKAQLPPFHTEMAAGLVPNVCSGLIANRLDLMGPNYILDAACASTLIAIDHAVQELQSGRADLMLTGGIQASTPPQIVMIFCQLGAISRGSLRPFSREAGGTLLGEGAGLFVLKRLADAQRDEDRIYAVIRGIGSSSDGKAKGLLAPRPEGEVLAIRRGYTNAGVDPATVEMVECHGTGIPLGDATEVGSLRQVFGEREGPAPRIAIGSVKSMIAHCLPAAGSAALMKAAMALHDKVLPPTLCDEVDPALELEKTPFYVNTETRPWIHDLRTPRRAGINAFGFGGVNAHLVVEEYRPRSERVQIAVRVAAQDREIFALAADSREALQQQVEQLAAGAQAGAFSTLQQPPGVGAHRAILVAGDAVDLAKRATALAGKLASSEQAFATRNGSAYGFGPAAGKLAFVFPGEGAQYPAMLSGLACRFPVVRRWLDFVDGNANAARPRPRDVLAPAPTALDDGQRAVLDARLFEMDMASESIFAASQGLHALLGQCGVRPDLVLGHSTGEHAALVAGGIYGEPGFAELAALTERLNRTFVQLQAQSQIATGALLTVGALDADARTQALAPYAEVACIAIDNCPNQAVVFVEADAADTVRQALITAGGIVAELPFDRAYHTDRFGPVTAAFRKVFDELAIQPPAIPVVSCASTGAFASDPDAIRDLACAQWSQPVRFRETILRLLDEGVRAFVEVGPSGNLTAFIQDTLKAAGKSADALAVSCNSRRQNDQASFLTMLGQLWCAGYPVDFDAVMRPAELRAEAPAEPALATVLPRLHWPEELAAELAPPAAAPVAATQPAPAVPVAPAPAAAPEAAVAQDPAAQIMAQHFGLMREFLAGQQRLLDNLQPAAPVTAPAQPPLLGQPPVVQDGRVSCEVHIDPATHAYLRDHTLGAPASRLEPQRLPLAVVPFTFSLEMLAQTAAALAPAGWVLVEAREVRGNRWLALDHGSLRLHLEAERLSQDADRCVLRGRIEDGGTLPAFSAELVFAAGYPVAPPAAAVAAPQPIRHNPPERLYDQGMFHGPRLRGVTALQGWSDTAIAGTLQALPRAELVSGATEQGWLTDPIVLDATGQLAGYWLSEKYNAGFNCFPYRIDRLRLFAPPAPMGAALAADGVFREQGAEAFEVDWQVRDARGQLLLDVQNWCDRRFAVSPEFTQWRSHPQQALLTQALETPGLPTVARILPQQAEAFWEQGSEIWLRVAAQLVLDAAERGVFATLTPTQRPDWLRGRIAAKEAVKALVASWGLEVAAADIAIETDALGAPQVRCPLIPQAISVSISHHGGRAVAIAALAELAVGIDLHAGSDLDSASLSATVLSPSERAQWMKAPPAEQGRLMARAWTAREAAAKAAGTGLDGRPDHWILEGSIVRGPRGEVAQIQWIELTDGGCIALATAPKHFMERKSA